jgi:hypothetical protein
VDRVRRQIVRRKAAEEEQHFLDEADEAAAPERQWIAREELQEIGRRLEGLPPKCQQAFVMHAMLEWPVLGFSSALSSSSNRHLKCEMNPRSCRGDGNPAKSHSVYIPRGSRSAIRYTFHHLKSSAKT